MKPDDEARLRQVYRDNVEAVFAFFGFSVSRAHAEDLTASTFERVVRSWKRYDPAKASERTWILAIARNLLTDHFRRQHHRQAVSLDDQPLVGETLAVSADPTEGLLDREEVRSWLAGLSDRDRQILTLRYGADLSAREIGGLMDLEEANVHQILSRTLRKLRDTVERTPS
ncbi:MAG: sigma-70 family RNA polymerase sigma factor [Solirubrobacteraceae bacterium]